MSGEKPQKMIRAYKVISYQGGKQMNKIYKVIWSKARHTYVVTSEIAKSHAKAESAGKGLKKLALALMAVLTLMGPGYTMAADTATVTDTAGTSQTVYTQSGADKQFAKKTDLATTATQASTNASQISTLQSSVSSLQTAIGDSGSGLKKDVNDLKTTVGDSTDGLVKEVADNTADIAQNKTDIATNKTAVETEASERAAKDTELNDRITEVKTYLQQDAADTYVSKDDASVEDGYAIKAENKVGKNVALVDAALASEVAARVTKDTAQDEAISTLTKNTADGIDTLKTAYDNEMAAREAADTTLQTNIDAEKTARESADSALDSRTTALETKTGSLNRVAAAHSTSINESMTIKGKQYSATLQVNAGGAQIGVVNNSKAGLGNDGGTAYTEYRSRTGAIVSKATNDISAASTDGQIIDTAGATDGEYSKTSTAKSTGTTFTYSDGTNSSSTTVKGDNISTGTVTATGTVTGTAGIIDGTTEDGTYVKVSALETAAARTVGQNLAALDRGLAEEVSARETANTALNDRITEVKNYLQQDAADTYVSKDDASVEDGYVIKKANTIGENVALVDKALSNEAAARVTADKAQNEAIATVNTNLVTAVNTINRNMADGFTALNAADAAEKESRISADKTLAEAVNSGLSLSDENVLQKNTTSVADDGTVTTSKTDATEMILNKDNKNQITMNRSGIKVGTNSTVIDEEGVYTGGDTYSEAKAAMKSDGSIKGASGKFTVNSANGTVNVNDVITLDGATGAVKANSLNIGDGNMTVNNDGNISTKGTLSAADGKFSVNTDGGVSAAGGKAVISSDGKITATAVDAGNGTIRTTGTIRGGTITDGTATLTEGKLTGLESVETKTLKTTGDAEIGGSLTVDKDLTVKGEFNADTLNSKVDKNNYTTISGGSVTSKNLVMSDEGNIQASYSKLDETGSNVWARDDDSKGSSTVTADSVKQSISDIGDNVKNYASRELSQNGDNKYEITDSVVEGNQSNVTKTTADTTDSQIALKDEEGNVLNKSYITQNLKKILQGVEEGDNKTTIEQDGTNITNTAANGTITNDADKILNKGASSITSQIGDGSAVKTVMDANGIANTATGGTISNTANDITNTASNKITNKALDVETDAASSIVNKVSNDYGTNTSTQTSSETQEEMSQADGKKASFIRGAAEEKSQLVNGNTKTTIDTIAGQTNTNITDGTNTSNDLQKADRIASSVNDGTNNTVVNQNATTISSSITNGTDGVYNNTSSTAEKSEQRIQTSDTQYSASTKTAARSEEALVNGSTILDIVKDSSTGTISAAVTDGTNLTGSTMTAKGITNSAAESIVNEIGDGSSVKSEMTESGINNTAKDGTITNDAKDVLNKGTNSVINEVGKNQVAVKTDSVKAAYGDDTYTTWDASGITSSTGGNIKSSAAEIENKATTSIKNSVGDNVESSMTTNKITESVKNGDKSNTFSKTAEKDISIVTDGTNTSTVSQLADGVNTSMKNGTQSLNNKKTVTEDVTRVTDSTTGAFSSSSQKADAITSTVKNGNGSNASTDTAVSSESKLTIGTQVIDVVKGLDSDGAAAVTSSVTDGTDTSSVKQTASGISASAKTVTTKAGESVTTQIGDKGAVKTVMNKDGIANTATGGTISNTADKIANTATTSIVNTVGKTTVTTNDSGTTFENADHNAAVKEGSATNTTISGNTITTGQATMDYADVLKDLGVRGSATVDGNTTLGKEGADTTLTVNSTSTFNKAVTMKDNATVEKDLAVNGMATFNDIVSVKKDLNVSGTTTTDKLAVTGDASVGGNLAVNGTTSLKDTHITGTLLVNEGEKNQVKVDSNGITVGLNSTVIDADGVYVGGHTYEAAKAGMDTDGHVKGTSFSVGDKTYIDSDGLNANGQAIRNVAEGTVAAGSTEAVTGGQLFETNRKVEKLDNKIDKVGANAAAMANLHPLEFDADSKWNIAAAVGSSGSETATAVGMFYRPNENVMVNASASMGTGENMFGGGVSVRLGHGGNKAREAQVKAAAAENRELRAQVNELTARMDALLSVLNPNMSKEFPDVPANHWAYEAVSRLAGSGIVEGYEDGKYHGERQLTRYEMAEIIYNALSKGAKAEKKLVEEFRPELQAMAAQKKA